MPSIILLIGLFQILKLKAAKMNYWTGSLSGQSKQWQQKNQKKPGRSRKLTLFEEFILTLLRLRRLGIGTQFLSTLFGVSRSVNGFNNIYHMDEFHV